MKTRVHHLKISEKSLELNLGAELLNLLRCRWGMPKAYLRGLTQREERQQGVDFFAQLSPTARIFAFQFKAPKGRDDQVPYRFTLVREQHSPLHALARVSPHAVFYVLPFYASHQKLQRDVPALVQDTWFLPIAPMAPSQVFGANKTKVVRCCRGFALVNPEYQLLPAPDVTLSREAGIPAQKFSSWYMNLRGEKVWSMERSQRMNPWAVRGLRVAIIESDEDRSVQLSLRKGSGQRPAGDQMEAT